MRIITHAQIEFEKAFNSDEIVLNISVRVAGRSYHVLGVVMQHHQARALMAQLVVALHEDDDDPA